MEEKLNSYSIESNSSKSLVVKEALAMYFKKQEVSRSAYEMGADLFGKSGSGNIHTSTTYKKSLKQKLHAKNTH